MKTRRLLEGEITYSSTKERETNILHQLGYFDQQNRFIRHLYERRGWIKAIVAHHLGLRSTDGCHIAAVNSWLAGDFNVCVPITIEKWEDRQRPGHRVMIRFPQPYGVGEDFRPGKGTKRFSAKPVPMHGSNRAVPTSRPHGCTGLLCQPARLYKNRHAQRDHLYVATDMLDAVHANGRPAVSEPLVPSNTSSLAAMAALASPLALCSPTKAH